MQGYNRRMELFRELTKLSFQRQITYRAATLAGLATNFFFGLLRAAVMVALYGARPEVAGISLPDAITYTGLSQASIGFLSLFGWYEIIRSVYSGDIGSDLLKPMDFYSFWMAQDLGRAIVQFLLRSLPILAFYALIFHITTPKDVGQWLALAITMILAWLVSFAWRFLVNLSAFWVPNAIGIARVAFTFAWFTSGFLMPLRFFPDWFARLCYLTPFPYTINAIIEVYLGLLSGSRLALILLGQAGWFLGLSLLSQFILNLGVRKLVIQGG